MRQWAVRDVMEHDIVTLREDTPYKDVVSTLVGHRVRSAPVVGPDGRVRGVVSEADLLHKLEFVGVAPGLPDRRQRRRARVRASARTAKELMTVPPITVRSGVAVSDVATVMELGHLDVLPVVDEDGRVVGAVSRADLLRVYLVSDDALRDEIRQHVLVGLLADDISTVAVDVTDGIVTLSGTVDRRSTADLIVQLVEAVAGVVDVCDDLGCGYDDLADLWCHQVSAVAIEVAKTETVRGGLT
jgi:CBS domain-containing protein